MDWFEDADTDLWGDSKNEEREKLKIAENKKSKILERDRKLYIRFMERQYVRISVLEDLIRLPEPGELLRLVTQQNFNAFALFLFILQREKVEEVLMTTYSVDKNTISALGEILEKEPGMKMTILIASLIKHDKPALREKLKGYAVKYDRCRFVECYNHTKIIAVKTKKNYYAIEGSGNLSANARIESYLFDNNKESFEFHKNWIEDVMNRTGGFELCSPKNSEIIK